MQKEINGNVLNFGNILAEKNEQIEKDSLIELGSFFKTNNITLSVVESVTGGAIAKKVIEVPGSSSFFLGGIVANHPKIKIKFGLVKPKTISKFGEVSSSVVSEMTDGIKKMTYSDVSIGSSGIIKDDNSLYSKDQSGIVFLSWNIHDKIKVVKQYHLKGERNSIIDQAVFIALYMCLNFLKNKNQERN